MRWSTLPLLVMTMTVAGIAAQGGGARRPQAEVTPVVVSAHVTAGAELRLALKVGLPEGIHVQSDKPRDPLLIPTALTIAAPKGVTLGKAVYPAATDLKQAGQKKPLAVFEREFEETVRGTVAADAARGPLLIPARLRYQACNAQTCFAPATAEATWMVDVE
jgi:DsbC/DsbD-like thiol-disulfide interchange protein